MPVLIFAQEKKAPECFFSIVINGKPFHAGDTIEKTDLKTVPSSLQLIDKRANKEFKPLSYHWALYIRRDSFFWTGNCPPLQTSKRCHKPDFNFVDLLNKAEKGDLIFVDEIKLNGHLQISPKQFAFTIR